MDLTPVYELRNRLRAAMIAGTNLISEDFRLKRAVNDIKPLESLSPIFAKIGQMAENLLADDCVNRESVLIDTITLVDALLCTQGQVAVAGDICPVEIVGTLQAVTNAPYSVVTTLVEALTVSGNGHYQYVIDTHNATPELFDDYRIKSAMVKALGAGYVDLADTVEKWLKSAGGEILPLLFKDFDPKGKKEMLRRIHVMEAVAPQKCNDFYLKMLPEAEKDIRKELIYALRHEERNVEYLISMLNTEKGVGKKMVYCALAGMEDESVEKIFSDLYAKKPIDVMSYLKESRTKWASDFVAVKLKEQLAPWIDTSFDNTDVVLDKNNLELLRMTVEALNAKNSEKVCDIYRILRDVIEIKYLEPGNTLAIPFRMILNSTISRTRVDSLGNVMEYLLEIALRVNPSEDLCKLAVELYESNISKTRCDRYFAAAFLAKLYQNEECKDWLEAHMVKKSLAGLKKTRNEAIKDSLAYVTKDISYDAIRKSYVVKSNRLCTVNESDMEYVQPIFIDVEGWYTDCLMNYSTYETDVAMKKIINPKNEEQCKKLTEYFYKKALVVDKERDYWELLNQCKCNKCENLLVSYLKRRTHLKGWEVYYSLDRLPGTDAELDKEVERVCQMINDNKINVQSYSEEVFLRQAELVKERRAK